MDHIRLAVLEAQLQMHFAIRTLLAALVPPIPSIEVIPKVPIAQDEKLPSLQGWQHPTTLAKQAQTLTRHLHHSHQRHQERLQTVTLVPRKMMVEMSLTGE
jgi:hypothetical protein